MSCMHGVNLYMKYFLQSRFLAEFHIYFFFIYRHSFGQIIGENTKYFKMWCMVLQARNQ